MLVDGDPGKAHAERLPTAAVRPQPEARALRFVQVGDMTGREIAVPLVDIEKVWSVPDGGRWTVFVVGVGRGSSPNRSVFEPLPSKSLRRVAQP